MPFDINELNKQVLLALERRQRRAQGTPVVSLIQRLKEARLKWPRIGAK